MSDKTRTVLYTNEASVGRITLNRPEKRNALNDELIEALKNSIMTAASAESTRVIPNVAELARIFVPERISPALRKISQDLSCRKPV